MSLEILRVSHFKKNVISDCPSIQQSLGFINSFFYFQIIVSIVCGYIFLQLFGLKYVVLNSLVAIIFGTLHFFIAKSTDEWLHKNRAIQTFSFIIVLCLLFSFLQSLIITIKIFEPERELYNILNKVYRPSFWKLLLNFYCKELFFTYSFKNAIVSSMTIALNIITLLVNVLPYILTFYYRNSKYYKTEEIIDYFKENHEKTISR